MDEVACAFVRMCWVWQIQMRAHKTKIEEKCFVCLFESISPLPRDSMQFSQQTDSLSRILSDTSTPGMRAARRAVEAIAREAAAKASAVTAVAAPLARERSTAATTSVAQTFTNSVSRGTHLPTPSLLQRLIQESPPSGCALRKPPPQTDRTVRS